MRRLLIAAFLLASPLFALADEGQGVEDLVAQLRSRYLREREAAVEALVACGPKVAARVTELLKDADGRVQRSAVEVLSRIGTPESIQPLLPLLSNSDPTIRGQVREAFLHLGRTVRPALESARDSDPKVAQDITELLEEMTQVDIEDVFAAQVMDDGTTGFYSGQFARLKSLGPDIGPMLAKMGASSTVFPFHKDRGGRFTAMAINAIADIEYKEAVPDLERVADGSGELATAAAGALWRLGKKEPAEKMIASLKDSMDQPGANAVRGGNEPLLAEIYSRTGQQDAALEMYQASIASGRANGTTYYNMGCTYARLGKKKEAIAALQRSVKDRQPFHNVEWLKIDGDLESLHGEPEFKQLVTDMGGSSGGLTPGPAVPPTGGGAGTD